MAAMRIGLGLRGENVTRENIAFAAQLGCTDIVVTPFRFHRLPEGSLWYQRDSSLRYAQSDPEAWSVERLKGISRQAAVWGLSFRTIENFDPADYCDIMLDGPRKTRQLDALCRMIQNAAAAGVTHIGYGFNPTGVLGRKRCADLRGGAVGLTFHPELVPKAPLPKGFLWNSVIDPDAPDGDIGPISHSEIWERYYTLLERLLPAAADCGITLCLHPTDPPVEELRSTARLVWRLRDYDRIFADFPQKENCMTFCMGAIQEMADTEDLSAAVTRYGKAGRLGYLHLRNVTGKVPSYREEFPDQGDIDAYAVIRALTALDYRGVLLPDHTPEMTVAQPWHTGMAFAVGYWKGLIQAARREFGLR